MRVALLTYSTKPRGGVVHTVELAEALARAGADVTLWSLARGGDDGFYRPVDPAVTVRLVPFPTRAEDTVGARILRSITLMRAAFDPDADIVHAQDCISANAVGHCIRTIHHLEQFTTPELAACHERAVTEPYARICVSRAVADEVRAGWGLDAAVIPNGVDHLRFASARGDEWRARLGRYVLAVGGIEPRKGSLDLLSAYAVLQQHHPDVRLVFAGGETLFDYRDFRAAFDARVASLGATHRSCSAPSTTTCCRRSWRARRRSRSCRRRRGSGSRRWRLSRHRFRWWCAISRCSERCSATRCDTAATRRRQPRRSRTRWVHRTAPLGAGSWPRRTAGTTLPRSTWSSTSGWVR